MPGTLRAGQGAKILRERREAEAKAKAALIEPEAPVEEGTPPEKEKPKRAKKAKE